MDSIISNLVDPAWWFTGLFFTALVSLTPKILRISQNLLKGTLKGAVLRRLRKIKSIRFNQSFVNYEIAKANSYLLIFTMICCFYLTWYLIGPFKSIIEVSPILGFLLSAPIYVSEVIWLRQDGLAKDLARARGRVSLERAKRTYQSC